MNSAAYLGDGVYAQRDDQGNLWLSTAGHIGSGQEENKICFERTEEAQLLYYLRKTSGYQPPAKTPVPVLPSTNVFRYCQYTEKEIDNLHSCLEWIKDHQSTLIELDIHPNPMGSGFVDFDNLTRDKVLAVIKAFPGKWHKTVTGGRMDYTQILETGISLRIYGAELPPSCKLIKKLVTIPEHTEERMEIECSTGKEAE